MADASAQAGMLFDRDKTGALFEQWTFEVRRVWRAKVSLSGGGFDGGPGEAEQVLALRGREGGRLTHG
jgi:hypothetical protein